MAFWLFFLILRERNHIVRFKILAFKINQTFFFAQINVIFWLLIYIEGRSWRLWFWLLFFLLSLCRQWGKRVRVWIKLFFHPCLDNRYLLMWEQGNRILMFLSSKQVLAFVLYLLWRQWDRYNHKADAWADISLPESCDHTNSTSWLLIYCGYDIMQLMCYIWLNLIQLILFMAIKSYFSP